MTTYTPHIIKRIHSALKQGDVKRIADELSLSTQTVHSAFNTKALTETNRRIFDHAALIVRQHEERLKAVKP